jgi:hypothetical protein
VKHLQAECQRTYLTSGANNLSGEVGYCVAPANHELPNQRIADRHQLFYISKVSFLSISCGGIKPTYLLHGLYNFHKAHFLGLLVAKQWWVFGPWFFHLVIKPGLIRIGLVLSSALLGLHSSKDVASGFTHHTFMLRAHTHTNIWFVKYSHTYLILCAQHHVRWQYNLFIW